MRAFPREPAQDIRLTFHIRGPESAVGVLGRHVKQDGIRFPKHETIVLYGRHFFIGIESEVLGSKLVATSEVNRLHLTVERKIVFQGHDAERTCRSWKDVEFHGQQTPLTRRKAAAHSADMKN